MTFQIGEKVVYPNYGVGTVESISTRTVGTHDEQYYLLRLSYNSATVMVPFSHVEDIRLRKVTKNAEIARVLAFLASGTCKMHADWKVRFRENTDMMASANLMDIAFVLKGLATLQAQKPLSFREKKMLDRARHMLITELSASRSLNEAGAIELLQKALAKASIPMPPPM